MNRREALFATLAGVSAVATIASTAQAAEAKADKPKADKSSAELEAVRALLKAHDDAMTNQDLPAVLATMTEKTAIMGTGPGEIWSGPEEIKVAYEHFFQSFDKGQQNFDYQFKIGGLGSGMGWLMASGNISGKKDGKDYEFPLNVSLTVTKTGGKWKIASMHFSTLTGNTPAPEKGT